MAPGFWLLLLVACLWGCCGALHEDQVGMSDWHQQYIGRATHAAFQTLGSGRKRVVVATERNIVASLNLRTGDIFWRQALAETEHIQGLEIVQGKYAVSLSEGGYLRAWHLPDGALIWETLLPTSSPMAQLVLLPVDLNNDRTNDLVILQGQQAYAVSSADGRIVWTADFEEARFSGTSLAYKDKAIYIAGFCNSSPAVYRVDSSSGQFDALEIDGLEGHISSSGFMIAGEVVVGLDTTGKSIFTGSIGKTLVLSGTKLSELLPAAAVDVHLLPIKLDGAFAISTTQGIFVVEASASSGLSVVREFQHPASLSDSLDLSEGKSVFAVVQGSGSEATVRVVANDWTDISKETVAIESDRGLVGKLFLNPYTRTDRSRGYRVLVVGEDDSLGLFQQGKVVWTREDALASVVDTATADLPVEEAAVSVANVEHGLIEWLKGQTLRLKSTLMLASNAELAILQSLRMNSAEKSKMVRDHQGFRKLIILLTSSGKLFALHSGNGRIVWSVLLPLFRASTGSRFTSLKLFPWQIPHHHALDENPVVLVLGTSQDAPSALSWVDMHTGKEENFLQLPYSVKQAIQLPVTDSSERRLHLLIDNEDRAHLFPATGESLALFHRHIDSTFYYSVAKEAGEMQGFSLGAQVDPEGYTFSTKKIWSVVFPRETEAITTVAVGRPDEVVHTQSKVLANRDVMYKYLNKNLIFVATVTPREVDNVGAANPEETWLVAYLIDAVTGQVLHRVSHPNAQGPVHAVLSENWVVYKYLNVRSQRIEMSVLEFYDKSANGKDVLQLILGRYNTSVPFSSFTRRVLEVKSQSYFFSSSVKTMTVTTTAKGITGKQILIGTVGNQVIALDKRFFDPRRSLAPTPVEREEGIIPLSEGLPIFPQSYVSHAARVEGLRGIVSIPARLESTCLVFAYGTDLFYTRTAPSRTYDSLTEDFSYALLLTTIVVLIVAIVISWVLSERKDLRDKWR